MIEEFLRPVRVILSVVADLIELISGRRLRLWSVTDNCQPLSGVESEERSW